LNRVNRGQILVSFFIGVFAQPAAQFIERGHIREDDDYQPCVSGEHSQPHSLQLFFIEIAFGMQLELEDEFGVDAPGVDGRPVLKPVCDMLGFFRQSAAVFSTICAFRLAAAATFSPRKLFLPWRQFQVIKISGHWLCPEWFDLFFDLPFQFLSDFTSFAVRIQSRLDIFTAERVSAFE